MRISLLLSICYFLYSMTCTAVATPSIQKNDGYQNQQEIKKLKDDLYTLEGSIFYKKHLSFMNPIREKTAFIIALAGICASCVAPFKLVPSDPKHRLKSYMQRCGIIGITLGGCMLGAYAVSLFRPILWYQEYKRDTLKKRIVHLQEQSKSAS